MTFDNSRHSSSQEQRDPEDTLEQGHLEEQMAALHARLSESEQSDEQAQSAEQVERLLRQTPLVAPLPGFAERVMAAIAALPLPAYVRRDLSVGLALGLLAVMMLTVPLLAVLFVLLVTSATSPAAWGNMLRGAMDAASAVGGLLLDAGDEVQALVSGTPVVPALLAITIPLVAVWGWALWQFWGKGHISLKQ